MPPEPRRHRFAQQRDRPETAVRPARHALRQSQRDPGAELARLHRNVWNDILNVEMHSRTENAGQQRAQHRTSKVWLTTSQTFSPCKQPRNRAQCGETSSSLRAPRDSPAADSAGRKRDNASPGRHGGLRFGARTCRWAPASAKPDKREGRNNVHSVSRDANASARSAEYGPIPVGSGA